MQPLPPELITLDNCLKLEFKKFYLGVSNGFFQTCYPWARLVYCLDCGAETFWKAKEQLLHLKRGMWLLIPPFIEVEHHHKNSHHLSLHFSYSLLRGVELLSGIKFIRYGSAPEFTALVENMTPDEPEQFLNCANILVRTILQQLMPLTDHTISSNMKLIRYSHLTDYLIRQKNPHISVAEMAKVMNLCEQTFARKFAADTGLTPRKLNENIIIDHAITLLENETLSIKEIAAELHFSSEYYFSRFFKRNTGVPPGRFRQKMQM